MDQAGSGDFAAYVRARHGALLRSALLFTGDHHRAEDLVQDAFIKLAPRWDRIKEGNPDAYVRRILYNDNISTWRRTRKETVTGDLGLTDDVRPVGMSEPPDPADVVTAVDVRRALQQLTSKQRAVLVLRYYDDLSEAQIAEVLGVSPGTVKSQAHAGLRRLRAVLPQAADALVSTEEAR